MAVAHTKRRPGAHAPLVLDRFIPYRLTVLANTVGLRIAAAYEERFGISIPEWRVIALLAQYPKISAVDVAERAAMDKVAVSRAVQALLSKRHVTRAIDKSDRRRSILSLSSSGQAVYKRIVPLAREFEKHLLQTLSVKEQKQLDQLLTRLMTHAKTLR